jgi:folate-binding protein YgfZ
MPFFHLEDREVIEVSGDDRYDFLQGLITQDIYKIKKQELLYSIMLSAQGRFLNDLFIFKDNEKIMLDCFSLDIEKVINYLKKFRLRAKVDFSYQAQKWKIFTSFDKQNEKDIKFSFLDPRYDLMGIRYYEKTSSLPEVSDCKSYELRRFQYNIPDTKDLIVGKDLALECNFQIMNAIDWEKGCYIGQEVTARTYYRNLIRRKLFCINLEEVANSKAGDLLIGENGNKVGEIRNTADKFGIAMINLDFYEKYFSEGEKVYVDQKLIKIYKPYWENGIINCQ